MDRIEMEFWSDGCKQASMLLSELDAMTPEQLEKFWWIQEEALGRTVLLRYVEEV